MLAIDEDEIINVLNELGFKCINPNMMVKYFDKADLRIIVSWNVDWENEPDYHPVYFSIGKIEDTPAWNWEPYHSKQLLQQSIDEFREVNKC